MNLKNCSISPLIGCLAFTLFAIYAVTTSAADSKAPATTEPAKRASIPKVNLKFEGESKVQIVVQNEELHIVAEVYFKGSGLLQAEWEVASPTSTAGKPQFNRLAMVRELLGLGKVLNVKSPPLPTSITGSYLVRFRVVDPESKLEPVTLGYSVGQAK